MWLTCIRVIKVTIALVLVAAFASLCAVKALLGQTTPDQQPQTSVSSTDVAVERTMEFINELYSKQGDAKKAFKKPADLTRYVGGSDTEDTYSAQLAKSQGSCAITTSVTWQHASPDGLSSWNWTTNYRFLLHLDKSDPMSITIETDAIVKPPFYQVKIEKVDGELREETGSDIDISGVLRSISGQTLRLEDSSGKSLSYKIKKHDFVGGDCTAPNECGLQVLRVGEYVTVSKEKSGKREVSAGLGDWHMPYVGYFNDRSLAYQAAKAFAHAIALCRQD